MENGQLESLPEIIECYVYNGRSWPNITGTKFTGTADRLFGEKKYSYTFNNLWNKKVSFCLELTGREFEYLLSFSIAKITRRNENCG
jgi:hypothetical protein